MHMLARRLVQPGSTLVGRRMAGGFPKTVNQLSLEEATLALERLQKNKANLEGSMARLKASLPAEADETATPEIVLSSYDEGSGNPRVNPKYIKTPWDSRGLDGGSPATLLKRATRQHQEMEDEAQALAERITSLK